MSTTSGPRYRLLAAPEPAGPGVLLDADQRRVVDHVQGPMLVLAGPGTGKTTTLVEAIARRIDDGARPEEILALTFGRKAAGELRDRVMARLGRTISAPMCMTFHSFAYGLIRAHAPSDLYTAPLRLLSAPEQDVQLRELLRANPESVTWPTSLHRALDTRGFASEVQRVLSRAREQGLDGLALKELGRQADRWELFAAGAFLEQYLDVLDQLGSTDHADLIRRAQIEADAHRDELRARYRHVFVDEYQDTDPGQVALLQELAGDGRNLVVVGDPHQSIYAFRGARVRGIMEFPHVFPTAAGDRAPVVTLRHTRRFGSNILAATSRVAARLPMGGSIDAGVQQAFAAPTADAARGGGRVDVFTFETARAEAEHLADLLRRAHLHEGLDWSEMAVLVRSGKASIPGLRRALIGAGVPVEVAGDEVPLIGDPAVRPLLDALRAAINLDNDDPSHPDHIDVGRAQALLTGPLGTLDAGELRRLGRVLRNREKESLLSDEGGAAAPRSSDELVRLAVVQAGFLDDLLGQHPELGKAAALNALLVKARAEIDSRASVEEVLWTLWSGTSWPTRLKRNAQLQGLVARRAHRDLDSVVALFDVAARTVEQRDHTGVANFLEMLADQQIPADVPGPRGVRGSGVRLMTAHRSKGLEWRLVVVAHVQAEAWPDLRSRASLLTDALTDTLQTSMTTRERLLEERRLFYVACTRARDRLIVTAVRSQEDDGEQPSRFITELLSTDPVHVKGRPARPLSLAGLVAELRRTASDPAVSQSLREAAARRLARLATEVGPRGPIAAQADPASWWGLRAASRSQQPLRSETAPVPLNASALKDIIQCPARWFWLREAGGRTTSHQQANVGTLVHSLAEQVATGQIATTSSADIDVLMGHVDQGWERFRFRTPWSGAREHQRVRRALQRFLDWHHTNPRQFLDAEREFATEVALDDGERIRVTGSIDRLEVDADGAVVVIDFKTGRGVISDPSVKADPQLALYQLAITEGGALDGRPVASGGAEIIQLGLEEDRPARVNSQPSLDPGSDQDAMLKSELGRAANLIRAEVFPATPNDRCDNCEFKAVCPAVSAGAVLAQ